MVSRHILIVLLFVVTTFGCTRVNYRIPTPVTSEEKEDDEKESDDEGKNDDNEEPADPTPDQDPNPDGGDEGDEGDDSSKPDFSDSVKYVTSKAEFDAIEPMAGDTIVWKTGIYDGVTIDFDGQGSTELPIVLTGERGGEVIFTSTSALTISGNGLVVENLWWRDPKSRSGHAVVTFASGTTSSILRECAITGANCVTDAETDYKWISLNGTDNTVENCCLTDKRNMGTLLVVWLKENELSHHTIRNNYFSRPLSLVDGNGEVLNGQETIRIGTSDYSLQRADCRLEGNHFYRCNGETEVVSNKSCGNIYEANLFEESEGTLTLRHGNDCTVKGNYFLGNGKTNTGGVRIIGERHTVEQNYFENLRGSGYKTALCMVRGEKDNLLSGYAPVRGAVVRNNTFYGCRYSMHLNYGGRSSQTEAVTESVIENNIICCTSSSDYSIYLYTSPAPEIEWNGNTIYGGRQKGVSITTVATPPTIGAVDAATEAIRAAAGPAWKEAITKQ